MVLTLVIGALIFASTVGLFKVLFFIQGVLFKGAGFIMKTLVLFIFVAPIVFVLMLLAGTVISTSTLVFITLGSFVLSVLMEGDRKARKAS